jgi:hypothetical protein
MQSTSSNYCGGLQTLEIKVQTLNEDGSILFDGVLRQHEVQFVLEVGVNFLLMNGASPFIQDEDEAEENMVGPGSETFQ